MRVREENKTHRKVLLELGNPLKVAEMLREYNRWRRGEGKYAWDSDPEAEYIEPPYAPKTLGRIIEDAADMLEGFGLLDKK